MKKRKIAILIDWYLPGTKAGGPVRSVYSIVNILKEYFDFYIITTNCDLGSNQPYSEIVADRLFSEKDVSYYYFSREKLSSKNIQQLFSQIKPDLIYLNSFWSYHLSISIVRLSSKGLIKSPILLAPRGMLGKGALGLKSFKKKTYLFIAKLAGWYKEVSFHATQNLEKQDIQRLFRSNKILVAPNITSGSQINNTSTKAQNKIKLFYLSRISTVKNLDFALTCLKDIKKEITVEYDIFGNLEDLEYWNECKAIIKELPANIVVTYKKELQFGEVQETISHYHALFLPTLNENFGHSIVESLLCGCPVIISDQTPWNDLEQYGAGYAINLKEKQKFIDAIVELAELNQVDFTAMSMKANKYICEKINIPAITAQYKNLFNDCIKNGSLNL